ncbi:hypothetical protein [Brevibacillus sp. BC25]|uniref:hypothetical protein n=1 Tax=Brevibacillus sp. BC25 TaxID=1144308 RepID=UPI0002713050|nr:hypothetical protein [Brevibacillus sp. BC25]EJL29975.1 hypothetical protein PMI05_01591 [Brevibacillus sp. BC25]
MKSEAIVREITQMTDQAKTMGELHELLNTIAYTIGGMVCHFDQDERSKVIIGLTESIGLGLMYTSKSLGEPCSIEMVVGRREKEETS